MQMRVAVALQLDDGDEHQGLLKLASQVYAHLPPDGLQVGDFLCHVETARHLARIEREGDEAVQAFSFLASLQGNGVAVIGFNIRYGGEGFWNSNAILQGYRKVGLRYELVSEEEALGDTGLVVDKINSPRENELWLFVHGQEAPQRYMGYAESMRLYSFDGDKFTVLWEAAHRINPEFKLTKETITVTYEDRDGEPPLPGNGYAAKRDNILLTNGGAVASTESLPKK
jgi:hypothetical protein